MELLVLSKRGGVMSYEGQNKQRALKILNSNESFVIGSIDLANSYSGPIELTDLCVDIAIENHTITNELAKLQIHYESTCNSLYAESDYFYFNLIDKTLASWRGMIRFDFNNVSLFQGTEYWVKLIMSNYTRANTNSYIGLHFDWPVNHSANSNSNPFRRPIRHDPYIRARLA
jgi:hypothetical protein